MQDDSVQLKNHQIWRYKIFTKQWWYSILLNILVICLFVFLNMKSEIIYKMHVQFLRKAQHEKISGFCHSEESTERIINQLCNELPAHASESEAQPIHFSQTFQLVYMHVQVIQTSRFLVWSEFHVIIRVKWIASCVCDIQTLLVQQGEDAICMTGFSFIKLGEFNGGVALRTRSPRRSKVNKKIITFGSPHWKLCIFHVFLNIHSCQHPYRETYRVYPCC